MEVVIPNRDALDRFPWEKKRSGFEERKDQVTRLVLRRSISVPENLSSSSDDSDSSSSYSRPRGNIPSQSISSQGLVRMIDDEDACKKAEAEEDEAKVFPNKGKGSGVRMFWGTDDDDDDDDDSSYYTSGSDDEYTYTEKSKALIRLQNIFLPRCGMMNFIVVS